MTTENSDSVADPTDQPTPTQEFVSPPPPSQDWENRLNRKIGVAHAFDRFMRSLAEIISGGAASVGSIMPVVTAFVVSAAFALSGAPLILALGAATAELVGIYIHNDYKTKSLTSLGKVLYITATVIVGLNIGAALFHIAYPTIYAEAATYGLSETAVAQLGTLNALAVVVPAVTAALAIMIFLAIPKTTQENRAETRKDSLKADRIDIEADRIKASQVFDSEMQAIEAGNDKQRVLIIAEQEKARLQHDGELARLQIEMQHKLATARIAAYIEAYQEALSNPAVKGFNRKLGLVDLVKQFQRDSGIHPNDKMFKELKKELVSNLIPDMDGDQIPDILADLERSAAPQSQSRQPSRNGQPV